MVTCYMQIMASQVLEVIPTKECCETQGNETYYLKLARISTTKLEHQFLDLGCCEWGFSVFRTCTQDALACFKELFHHGVL